MIPKQVMFQANDIEATTSSTDYELVKSFRFSTLNGIVNYLTVFFSVWNDDENTTTSVKFEVDNTTTTFTTPKGITTEKLYHLDLNLPTTPEIHTLKMYLSTSDSNYRAHTKLFEVIGR